MKEQFRISLSLYLFESSQLDRVAMRDSSPYLFGNGQKVPTLYIVCVLTDWFRRIYQCRPAALRDVCCAVFLSLISSAAITVKDGVDMQRTHSSTQRFAGLFGFPVASPESFV